MSPRLQSQGEQIPSASQTGRIGSGFVLNPFVEDLGQGRIGKAERVESNRQIAFLQDIVFEGF